MGIIFVDSVDDIAKLLYLSKRELKFRHSLSKHTFLSLIFASEYLGHIGRKSKLKDKIDRFLSTCEYNYLVKNRWNSGTKVVFSVMCSSKLLREAKVRSMKWVFGAVLPILLSVSLIGYLVNPWGGMFLLLSTIAICLYHYKMFKQKFCTKNLFSKKYKTRDSGELIHLSFKKDIVSAMRSLEVRTGNNVLSNYYTLERSNKTIYCISCYRPMFRFFIANIGKVVDVCGS